MSDQYPTVGLKVDLSGIDAGQTKADKLKKTFQEVGEAAAVASEKVNAGTKKTTDANVAAVASTSQRAKSAERAAAAEARAAAISAKEQEQTRRYLQSVRIRSIQMEEAARVAQQSAEARDMRRVAAEQQRALTQQRAAQQQADRLTAAEAKKNLAEMARAEKAAVAQREAQTKYLQGVKIRSIQMEEAANRKAAAEAQRLQAEVARAGVRAAQLQTVANDKAAAEAKRALADVGRAEKAAAAERERQAKYLLGVKLRSFQMEEAAARKAAAEQARAMRGGSGGGGGSGGSIVGPGDIGPIGRFTGALSTMRDGLKATRSLLFDVRTAIGVFLGGMVIRPIIQAADAMTALEARTRFYAATASDVPYTFEAIYQTAQRARAPLEAIATLYTRLAPLAKQLGKNQLELLRISETVAKGAAIGGATAEEAKASSQQLAQALASNRFGGDELRSVAENAPILLAKIAESLNMNTGQFIKWAQAGKANSAVVIKALEDARESIDRLFSQMPMTIGQATTVVSNAFTHMIGQVNKATNLSVDVARFIASFAGFLDAKSTVDGVITAITTLQAVLKGLGAVLQTIWDYLPTIATFAAILAGAAAFNALSKAMLASQIIAAGIGANFTKAAIVTNLLGNAARAAGAAFMALFSPVNIVIGLLVGGVALMNYFADSQKKAAAAADNLKSSQEGAVGALDHALSFAKTYGIANDGLKKSLDDVIASSGGASSEATKGASANDQAMDAARRRMEIERLLAINILARAAADARARGAEAMGSVRGMTLQRDLLTFTAKHAPDRGVRAMAEAESVRLSQQIAQTSRAATDEYGLAATLYGQQGAIRTGGAPTIPGAGGNAAPAAAAAANATKDATDSARNAIEKMKEEVLGLQRVLDNLSANPLSALQEQIEKAGAEARAAREYGRNKGLADQAATLAMDKERLTILVDMKRASVENQRQAENETAAEKAASEAAIQSQNVMRAFWAGGSRDLVSYNAALQRSRDILTTNAVATSNLAIAQRFGVTSLDQISEALEKNGIAYGKNAQAIEDAAIKEANAAAARIKGAAANSAAESAPEDVAAFNTKAAEEFLDALSRVDSAAQSMAENLSSAFGSVGEAMGSLLTITSQYMIQQQTIADNLQKQKDLYKDPTSKKYIQAEKEAAEDSAKAQIHYYGDLIGAAKGFFNEKSLGYKVMETAERGFRLFEFAMSAKSIAVQAFETAAKVGLFGTKAAAAAGAGAAEIFAAMGPFGFPVVAAMVAVLAGLGVSLAGGSGGGAIPGANDMADRQAAQGSGSVLGDASAKSESIANALQIVDSNWNKDLEYSNDMARSLRSIDSQISSLAAAVARTLGAGGSLSTEGLGLGEVSTGPGLLQKIFNPISALLPGLFGTKTTRTLQDQGLDFGTQTVGAITGGRGVTGSTYQQVLTETQKKFLGVNYSNKASSSTTTSALDGDLARQITLVIGSLKKGVLDAAKILGVTGAEATLNAYALQIGKVSLKDLKGDEIEAALASVIGKAADGMAGAAIPGLEALQEAGEGLFETLIRVAREYQVVDVALSSIGMTFGAVGMSSLEARKRLIDLSGGIDAFAEGTAFFAENFLTEAERMAPMQKAVGDALSGLGLSAELTRDQFKSLVLGLDVSTEAGANMYAALLNIMPAFDKVTKYTDGLTESANELARSKANEVLETRADIEKQIFALTHTSIEVRDAERAATLAQLAALDATLPEQMKRVYALQDEADATERANATAAAAAAAAKQLAADARTMDIRIMELTGKTVEAVAANRAIELERLDESLRPRQLYIWQLEDEIVLKAAAAEAANDNNRAAREASEVTQRLTAAYGNMNAAAEASARAIEALASTAADVEDAVRSLNDLKRQMALDSATAANNAWIASLEAGSKSADEMSKAADDRLSEAQRAADAAHDAVSKAYESEAAALRNMVESLDSLGATLAELRQEIVGTGAGDADRYRLASARLGQLSANIAGGDMDAASALPDAIKSFLSLSQDNARTSMDYRRDVARAAAALDAAQNAISPANDNAQAQLDALNAQVAGIVTVNETLLSLRDAILANAAAQAAVLPAQQEAERLKAYAASVAASIEAIKASQAATEQEAAAADRAAKLAAAEAAVARANAAQAAAIAQAIEARDALWRAAQDALAMEDLARRQMADRTGDWDAYYAPYGGAPAAAPTPASSGSDAATAAMQVSLDAMTAEIRALREAADSTATSSASTAKSSSDTKDATEAMAFRGAIIKVEAA